MDRAAATPLVPTLQEDGMPIARSFPAIAVAVIAIGCAGQDVPTTPRHSSPAFSEHGVDVSVNGGGIIDLSTAGVGDAYFTFNAIRKADGTVLGRFHERRERDGMVIEFSGIVTCLTVDAALMRARIGGIITENSSTDPAFLTLNHEVGDDVWFRVVDGGEGKGGVDGSTVYGFKPTLVNTSAEYCALPFTGLPWWNPATTFPLRSGNIQIRP